MDFNFVCFVICRRAEVTFISTLATTSCFMLEFDCVVIIQKIEYVQRNVTNKPMHLKGAYFLQVVSVFEKKNVYILSFDCET